MSEILERVSRIRHLPLFPLPLVMFPNELIPLHIFEDRYRQMLADIESEGGLFGILTVEPNKPGGDSPPVGAVGCVAEVRESELLPDGRSNIIALGLARFRLVDYVAAGSPYLIGDVAYFEDEYEPPELIDPLADEVFSLFERMAKAAFSMSRSRRPIPQIDRTDPESLTFLISAAFNFDNEKKYKLLEMTSTTQRLSDLRSLLQIAVTQLEETANIQEVSGSNGHSPKKIDL